jgi:microcystin-dependent protein
MAEPFLAEIRMFSSNFAPKGWAFCNGQLLPINQNQALFALLGTNYGGDGRVNFALPNLIGRVPLHSGPSHNLAQSGGENAHTVSIAEMPTHAHALLGSSSTVDGVPSPVNNVVGRVANWYAQPANLQTLNPGSVANVGGSQAHTNQMPNLVITFCIALQGIFPSQN